MEKCFVCNTKENAKLEVLNMGDKSPKNKEKKKKAEKKQAPPSFIIP